VKVLSGLSINKGVPDLVPGSWGEMGSRNRKGMAYGGDWLPGPAPGGVNASKYQNSNRYLSSRQCWDAYRRCSDLRASVDSIVRRVATFDWVVNPTIDPHDERYGAVLQVCQKVRGFLLKPNRNGDTWQEIMTAFLTDTLVYDAGVLELVYDMNGALQELVPLNGSSISPVLDDYGRILEYEQNNSQGDVPGYLHYNQDDDEEANFRPDEIIYFSLFKNTTNPAGNPLIEALVYEIIGLLRANQHAMLNLDADEIPPGILVLAGIAGRAAEEAKADLQKLKGQDHKIRVMTTPDPSGVGAKWLQLKRTPKDIEMRSVIMDLRRAVYRTFGVMPIEMGLTEDMPRATATAQLDVSSSHLVTPILELLQAKINSQVIPSYLHNEDISSLISFTFDRESRLTPKEQQDLASTHQTYVRNGIMTRNEIRGVLGMLPLPGGDVATLEVAGMPTALDSFGSPPPLNEDFQVEDFSTDDLDEELKEEAVVLEE